MDNTVYINSYNYLHIREGIAEIISGQPSVAVMGKEEL
jgi:hypothetical protein